MIFAHPLTWDKWILWVLENEPERIFDAAERDRFVANYWEQNPRMDGIQRQRARGQGVLAAALPRFSGEGRG